MGLHPWGSTRRVLIALTLITGIGVLVPSTVSAQAVTGTLLGNVTDSTGAAVPGATVTATETRTSAESVNVSDASGVKWINSEREFVHMADANGDGLDDMIMVLRRHGPLPPDLGEQSLFRSILLIRLGSSSSSSSSSPIPLSIFTRSRSWAGWCSTCATSCPTAWSCSSRPTTTNSRLPLPPLLCVCVCACVRVCAVVIGFIASVATQMRFSLADVRPGGPR